MVSVQSSWGLFSGMVAAALASAAYETAARAVYYPISVPCVTVIKRVWWANGATTSGGATIEVGIYRDGGHKPGTKLISGSATQGNTNEVQFVDVTDTTIPPGIWWLAIMASSATNTTLFRSTHNTSWDTVFRFQQNSANPLPSTATPVESSGTNIWQFGFSTTTIT